MSVALFCQAKNLSVAVLSQAPTLLVIKSWMSTTGVVFIFSHIKNSWIWHCSTRLKNLSEALRSQAPALLVAMSPRSGRSDPMQKVSSSTNQKPWKYELDTTKQSKEIWVLHRSAKLLHKLRQCPCYHLSVSYYYDVITIPFVGLGGGIGAMDNVQSFVVFFMASLWLQ